ncbi:MAG: PhoU domain-containing protein [Desulfoferrobacter sp.]
MTKLSLRMLSDTMQAYDLLNVGRAIEVWHRDRQMDMICTNLVTKFPSYVQQEPQSINIFTSLLFIARCLERIGDHIKNVNEHIYFVVYGKTYKKTTVPW